MDSLLPGAAALNERHGIAGRLAFAVMYGGIVAVLSHGGARAIVALQGAQVLSYETPDCGEVLWLSPHAQLGTGKPVRGGIPVCWPWFGPHPGGGGQPAHGLVRARSWRVAATSAGGDGTRLSLDVEPADASAAAWPHRARVTLDVTLTDEGLVLGLSTENLDAAPLALTQALHTYLRAGGIDAVTISGLEGCAFIDQLDPGPLKREAQSLRIGCEVDRIYQGDCRVITLSDTALARTISVASGGSASAVVWNPWIEKSARLGDMGPDGYRHMVCIETANAGADVVHLTPGARHTLSAHIRAVAHS